MVGYRPTGFSEHLPFGKITSAIRHRPVEHALTLYRRGYVALPLRRGGKHLDLEAMGYAPLHFQTRRKTLKELAFTSLCYQLSQKPPSEADILSWFTGFSGNIGILGGYEGLTVLDFDCGKGFRRWGNANEALLSSTPIARSPRGYHVFVRTQQPVVTSSMYLGLRRIGHLKSLGGYVVASPSVLSGGGAYEWLDRSSPVDTQPSAVGSLEALGLRAMSPLKSTYDRALKRGFFDVQ